MGHDWTGLDWTGLDLLVGIGTVYITAGCFSFATSAAPTLGKKKVKLKIEGKKKQKKAATTCPCVNQLLSGRNLVGIASFHEQIHI